MQTAQALQAALSMFKPMHMTLENESHMHAGYVDGKESHFKLVIVSDVFAHQRLTARHQAIYAQIGDLLTTKGGSVHALAIHAYTPDEWAQLNDAPQSPNCAGQNKGD